MCYICGQKFGKSSLLIHQKQCEKKFEDQQALLPPGERKALPRDPGSDGLRSEAEVEAAVHAAHEALQAECPHCGRTFNPDRIALHLKSCTASNPSKAVGELLAGSNVGPMNPQYVDAVRTSLAHHGHHENHELGHFGETRNASPPKEAHHPSQHGAAVASPPRDPNHAAGRGAAAVVSLTKAGASTALSKLEARVGHLEDVISSAVAELADVKKQMVELRRAAP